MRSIGKLSSIFFFWTVELSIHNQTAIMFAEEVVEFDKETGTNQQKKGQNTNKEPNPGPREEDNLERGFIGSSTGIASKPTNAQAI